VSSAIDIGRLRLAVAHWDHQLAFDDRDGVQFVSQWSFVFISSGVARPPLSLSDLSGNALKGRPNVTTTV